MTKHYTSEKTNYFAYWTLLGVLAFVRALALGRLGKARAIMLALMHAYSGRYGNVSAYPELRAQPACLKVRPHSLMPPPPNSGGTARTRYSQSAWPGQ